MKKIFGLVMIGILLPTALVLAEGQQEVAEQVTIKLGSGANEKNIQYEATKYFADLVRERTNGQIDIQLFFSGQLGTAADMIDSLQVGGIQMMQSFPPNWTSYVPEIGVLNLPFQFSDFDHVRRATDGKVGEELATLVREQTGVVVLQWWPHGFRNMYTKRLIENAADMKGLKIRVPPADVFVRTFKLLEASPVSIPWSEVYTGLQTGMVEAAEADLSGALASGFHEVTDYVIKTGHIYTASFLVIKEDFLQQSHRRSEEGPSRSSRRGRGVAVQECS